MSNETINTNSIDKEENNINQFNNSSNSNTESKSELNDFNKVKNPIDCNKRRKFKTWQKILVVVVLILACLLIKGFTVLGQDGSNADNPNGNQITCLDDLNGKKLGSLVGSACLDDAVRLAGDTGKALGFNTTADAYQALQSNKVDAVVLDGPLSVTVANKIGGIEFLDEYVSQIQYGAIFSKTNPQSQKLKNELDQFINKIKADGQLDKLWDKWTSNDESIQTIDYSGITGQNGQIEIPTSSSAGAPSVYFKNNEIVGLDIDLAVQFCAAYGYKPVFKDMQFDGIIMSITTNKYPISFSSFTITPERAESVDFSTPYYDGGVAVSFKTDDKKASLGPINSIISGFQRTFIDENRWEMFVSGATTTFLISIFAILFGTIIGFIVFYICHKGGRWCNKIVDCCIWILKGMPTVVLLMILFYIVFGKSSLGGVFVSVVAFTLLFAAAVVGLLRTGIDAIDEGQREAGLALGYTESKTFTKIILPQAVRHILPNFEGEAIEILKGTSIVGYIAVQDLTKVGDIIRSATYDAIFPLLSVALIYFVLEGLVKLILKVIDYLCYTRRRKNSYITKGINSIDVDSPEGKQKLDDIVKDRQKQLYNYVAKHDSLQNGSGEEIINLQHMSKTYKNNNLQVLKDVNANIYEGDVITLIGGSGCGKSTLIRCLNYLDPPTSGSVIVKGQDITDPEYDVVNIRKTVGTIFQRWNLFDHWTVVENVMLPMIDILNVSRQEAYDIAVNSLTLLGLGSKIMSYPRDLSGGQQQRVAIARTFVMRNDIVVLDEPTSALDPCTVSEVAVCLRYFALQGKTLIIVTHDMQFAQSISNRIFFICDGKIYEEGSPEQILENPQKEKTKDFINQTLSQELIFEYKNTNIPEIVSEVSDICMRYRIPIELEEKIQSVLGITMAKVIIPNIDSSTNIKAKICYAQKTKIISLVWKLDKELYNLFDRLDDECRQLYDSCTSNYEISNDDESDYKTKIVIEF